MVSGRPLQSASYSSAARKWSLQQGDNQSLIEWRKNVLPRIKSWPSSLTWISQRSVYRGAKNCSGQNRSIYWLTTEDVRSENSLRTLTFQYAHKWWTLIACRILLCARLRYLGWSPGKVVKSSTFCQFLLSLEHLCALCTVLRNLAWVALERCCVLKDDSTELRSPKYTLRMFRQTYRKTRCSEMVRPSAN